MNHEALQLLQFAPHTTHTIRQRLAQLATVTPPCLYLRDGEVVVYLRDDSPYYQCRYKLADGTWHRASTRLQKFMETWIGRVFSSASRAY